MQIVLKASVTNLNTLINVFCEVQEAVSNLNAL